MKNSTLLLLIILVVVLIGAGLYAYNRSQGPTTIINNNDDNTVCTMDAQQCPDGSYVGRVPPSCNFAPCPTGGGTGTTGVDALIDIN